jgi:hypothetical protein
MTAREFDDRHIFRMTDDTGMFQHAIFGVPNPCEGYTTDDNARALLMADMLFEKYGEKKYENLIYRYLEFLLYAQKKGWFRNFMGYDRNFIEKRGSEDCFGRCLMALGYTVSRKDLPRAAAETCRRILRRTCQSCASLSCIKGKAYALIGLILWNEEEAHPLAELLSESILDTYVQNRRENWRWFEEEMTYCSAILPLSMLFAFDLRKENRCREVGLESLDFLVENTMRLGYFKPVGCKGWFKKDGAPAEFDEQPVEACGMMIACLKAYEIAGDEKYRRYAEKCLNWYSGENSLNLPMIDPETGGCRDGITASGFNDNEGAESIVCYAIAQLASEQQEKPTAPVTASGAVPSP